MINDEPAFLLERQNRNLSPTRTKLETKKRLAEKEQDPPTRLRKKEKPADKEKAQDKEKASKEGSTEGGGKRISIPHGSPRDGNCASNG